MDLLSTCSFSHIVETGTFRGSSTAFFARQSGLPALTVESDPRAYAFSRLRLKRYPSIQLYFGDSIQFLRKVSDSVPPSRSRPFSISMPIGETIYR
jgi:predicted O-methyltransferase YrrM